jgi:nicotinate-nucleotide adenylyltransferase
MANIGLFFGTFNPIHVGHLIIANHLVETTDLEKVWLVVSPQNPLKQKSTLLNDNQRLMMVRLAVEDNPNLLASNIEFELEKPSYTVKTLAHLKEKYPNHRFSLIMGEDNLRTFHKWYNYEKILSDYTIYVYPRLVTEAEKNTDENTSFLDLNKHPNITFCRDTPVLAISASFIRSAIQKGQDVSYLLTEPVYKYVDEMRFYR